MLQERTITPRRIMNDTPNAMLPDDAVTFVDNVRVADGVLEAVEDYRTQTLAVDPYYLVPNITHSTTGEEPELVVIGRLAGGGASRVIAQDSALTEHDITPVGWAPTYTWLNEFTADLCNQLPVFNAYLDIGGPRYWAQDTATVAAALPDWPANTGCGAIRTFRDRLIAMDIRDSSTRYPDRIKGSDIAPNANVPQSWTVAANTRAIDRSITSAPGAVIDGAELRDVFMIYKNSSVHLAQIVGGVFEISNRPVFRTFGALCRNCVQEWRGGHVVLTQDDLVWHDGTTARSLVGPNRRHMFERMEQEYAGASFLAIDRQYSTAWVFMPREGINNAESTVAFMVNLQTGEFGERQVGNGALHAVEAVMLDTAAARAARKTIDGTGHVIDADRRVIDSERALRTVPRMMIADTFENKILSVQRGYGGTAAEAGAAITNTIQRVGLGLGSLNNKSILHVLPQIEGPLGATVQVRVGAHDGATQTVRWSAYRDHVIGSGEPVDGDLRLGGRYVAYEIRSTGDFRWRLASVWLQWDESEEMVA